MIGVTRLLFWSRISALSASVYLVPSLKTCPTSMPFVSSSVPPSFLGDGSPATALRISATEMFSFVWLSILEKTSLFQSKSLRW